MKKYRKLNLNKISIVSLKNMHTVIGGNTSQAAGGGVCDTKSVDDTLATGASDNGCSTGTNDPSRYQTTSNNGDTFGVLISQPGNECRVDDLTD